MASEESETIRKILIVDDDPWIRRLVATTLGLASVEIIEAPDGERALQAAQRERPHLILLDLMIPAISGIEVCRRIKTDAALSKTYVIVLTGYRDARLRIACQEAGADEYLTKPFSPVRLLARIEQIFEEHDASDRELLSSPASLLDDDPASPPAATDQ